MQAKRGKLHASTPARSELKNFFAENKAPSDIGSPPPAKKKVPVLDMIVEAINAIGIPKKGASYQAIKKWITVNNDTDPARLKYSLKMALQKGIDKGILQRPPKSSAVGATGSFLLVLPKQLKPLKKIVNHVSKPLIPPNIAKILPSKASASGVDTKTAIATKPPNQSKKAAMKLPKPSSKKTEMDPTTSSKAKAEKNPSKKDPSKANNKKKPATKLPAKNEAGENVPAVTELISEVPKKRKSTKNKALRNKSLGLRGIAKMNVSKSFSKAKNGKKTATKVSSKTKNAAKLDKESREDPVLSNAKSDEDPVATRMISATTKNQAVESWGFVFSESDAEISKTPKRRVKAKAPTKNKTAKNNVEKSKLVKVKEVSSIEDKKGKVKETKKIIKPSEISKDQINVLQKNARTANSKVPYAYEFESD